MSVPRPISDELRPYIDRADAPAADTVGLLLRDGRGHPAPGFREELGRTIERVDPVDTNRRQPKNPGLIVAVFAFLGLLLLALAAISVANGGPLG